MKPAASFHSRRSRHGNGTFSGAAPAAESARTLRVGMPIVPDTLDPVRASDLPALMLMAGLYDTLYTLDPLAPSTAIVPLAAEALPEISPDHRTLTVRVRRGILFTPHRSFGGKPRELVAADFAYGIRRVLDPRLRSPGLYLLEGKIEGLDELAARAKTAGTGLDYDAPIPGLVVLDRQTLRITLARPDPMFPFLLANVLLAAVPREAVEAEGNAYSQSPVGTGAFIVERFTPRQRLVYVRNPGYRRVLFDDLLTPSTRTAQPSHPMRGVRLPAAQRIEFSTTPEASAELLAVRRGELDLIMLGAPDLATGNGQLKPELSREGLVFVRRPSPSSYFYFFSLRDPVVGGNDRPRIALRRAIAMSFDDDEWIRVFDAGFSTLRQQAVPPGVDGYLDGYRNPNMFDPTAANALLDRFGYLRGPDGYRRNADGSALVVPVLFGTSSTSRQAAEFMKRMLDRIGVRGAFEFVPVAERLKRMSQCRFGLATMDWSLDVPDGANVMSMFWSRAIGSANLACYTDPAFDAVYEKVLVTPSGPARTAMFRAMQERIDAYAPARPLPIGDMLLLKRNDVRGPYGAFSDWLGVLTLGFQPAGQSAGSR